MDTKQLSEDRSQHKTRRPHRKSRNGCGTCLIRHVKCDEKRPICERCVKAGLRCDGYKVNIKKKDPRSTNPTPMSIRMSNQRSTIEPQTHSASNSICRSPPRSLFKNEQEYQYFQVFTTEIASQLTGLFPTSLWNYLILQACESNSSIRHAVIAVGALDPKTWRGPAKSQEEILRRQFAYHQYSMAIGDMRKTISKKALDLRTRLIACLLFICFEMYHFNKASAVAQIRAMNFLLEEQSRKRDVSDGPKVDTELEEAFQELETQSLVYDCSGSLLSQQQMLVCRQTMRTKLPQQFVTMGQARSMLHLLEVRQYYWTGASRYEWPWYLATPTMGTTTDPPPNKYTSNEEWCAERDRRFEEYAVWSNAFQPLLFKARTANDPYELRRATILRAMFLSAYLSLMVPMLRPQEAYYGQTARLRELLDLIKSLLTTSSNIDNGFSMEMNFVVPLSRVCYRFRHRALRQEAIKLLLSYPRREGLFDSVLIGTYSQWLADIEEEGLGDEEYVPHELVTSITDVDYDTIQRTAKLTAFQKVKDDPGKMAQRQTIISW